MKQILAGLFAVGTAAASFSAYKTDQFAPLITEIKQLHLPSPLALVTPGSGDSQTGFGSGYTNPLDQGAYDFSRSQAAGGQTGYYAGYAGVLLPHLQAAFSPLESNSTKLAEEPLLRLREILERDHETAEAREAIRMLEQLRGLLREREIYRARYEEGARRFDGESFRRQVAEEWRARGRELAPPFEHAYGELSTHEEASRQHGEQAARTRESYADMARRDPYTRPQFEGHADYGAFAHRETAHAETFRNPLEQNRSPFEGHRSSLTEYHSPLESHYHSPLEQGASSRPAGTATGHETFAEGSHQSSTTRPMPEQYRGNGATAPTSHSLNPSVNQAPHPVSKPPPPPAAHAAPPPVAAHTN